MSTPPSFDGGKSWADVLSAFEEAVRLDESIDLFQWLLHSSDRSRWPAMIVDLLRVGCQVREFDFDWLEETFDETNNALVTEEIRSEILRLVAADEAAVGRRVRWQSYERFGIDCQRLKLRGEGDCFFLGQVIGPDLRLDERIGAGGFGVVHRATALQRDSVAVAVKSPRRHHSRGLESACECLRREAGFLSCLRIPNVPRFYEWGEAEGIPFFSMEWIEGRPVEELVRAGPLDWREALKLAASVARIVDEAHRAGHLHGDLKASNVFVRPNDEVCVLDWGSTTAEDWRRPENKAIAGTTILLSTEVLLDLRVNFDLHQDIYALGVFLFYLVTGRLPPIEHMPDAGSAGTWKWSWFEWFVESGLSPSVPLSVRDIFRTILTKSQDYFPDTAADFVEMCERAAAEPEQRVPIPMRPEITAWQLGLAHFRCAAYLSGLAMRLEEIGRSPDSAAEEKGRLWNAIEERTFEAMCLSVRIHALMSRLLMPAPPIPDEVSTPRMLGTRDPAALKRFVDQTSDFLDACIDISRAAVEPHPTWRGLFQLGFATVHATCQPEGRFRWINESRKTHLPKTITKEFYDACRLAAPVEALFPLAVSLDCRVRRFLRWGLLSDSDEQVFGRPIAPWIAQGFGDPRLDRGLEEAQQARDESNEQ